MSRIINTKYGKIKGYERNSIIEYLGIPFAKPPIEDLRFKRAKEIRPWNNVFDASKYGQKIINLENGKKIGSEVCLTVNIHLPLKVKIFQPKFGFM